MFFPCFFVVCFSFAICFDLKKKDEEPLLMSGQTLVFTLEILEIKSLEEALAEINQSA